MSEIQALEERVRVIGQRVDFWNTWMVAALVLAAIAAFAVVWTTVMSLRRSGQLNDSQSELIRAKDRQLALDLRDKDKKIADANKATEDERMARVTLQEAIAWRRMEKETRLAFGAKFLRFSGQRSGIAYNLNDVEASGFATDLALALHDDAKWNISEPQPVMKMREGPVPVGTNPPLERGSSS